MNWADTITEALRDNEISLIAYVPDVSIHQVTQLLEEDPYFHVVSATREEEAIGIAAGAYAAGAPRRGLHAVQRVRQLRQRRGQPVHPLSHTDPLFHQPCAATWASSTSARSPWDEPRARSWTSWGCRTTLWTTTTGLRQRVGGALELCYASHQPVALCLTPMLHGGKLA